VPQDSAAIIVAGGKGLRYGGPTRKQYLKLAGKPLLWWSIHAFEQSASVGSIVVVVPAEDVRRVQALVSRSRFRKVVSVVAGGAERRDSVRHGLEALPPGPRWIGVHDAVRPLIRKETIEATFHAARRDQAALAACRSKDTVKIVDASGYVKSSPDRNQVWLAQTPQCFERSLLERAHRKGRDWPVTDDAQMVERLGVRVKIVEAPAENIKITTPMDLKLAQSLCPRA